MKRHILIATLAVATPMAFASIAAAQTKLPAEIEAAGETAFLTLHAEGAQVYECKEKDGKLGWAGREPIATLILDGKTVGWHGVGPAWDLTDGSSLTGKILAVVPAPTGDKDVPWVKLAVASSRGTGKLTGATTIQRINTVGGKASGTCAKAGELQSVAYSTDYVFSKKP